MASAKRKARGSEVKEKKKNGGWMAILKKGWRWHIIVDCIHSIPLLKRSLTSYHNNPLLAASICQKILINFYCLQTTQEVGQDIKQQDNIAEIPGYKEYILEDIY